MRAADRRRVIVHIQAAMDQIAAAQKLVGSGRKDETLAEFLGDVENKLDYAICEATAPGSNPYD